MLLNKVVKSDFGILAEDDGIRWCFASHRYALAFYFFVETVSNHSEPLLHPGWLSSSSLLLLGVHVK